MDKISGNSPNSSASPPSIDGFQNSITSSYKVPSTPSNGKTHFSHPIIDLKVGTTGDMSLKLNAYYLKVRQVLQDEVPRTVGYLFIYTIFEEIKQAMDAIIDSNYSPELLNENPMVRNEREKLEQERKILRQANDILKGFSL